MLFLRVKYKRRVCETENKFAVTNFKITEFFEARNASLKLPFIVDTVQEILRTVWNMTCKQKTKL